MKYILDGTVLCFIRGILYLIYFVLYYKKVGLNPEKPLFNLIISLNTFNKNFYMILTVNNRKRNEKNYFCFEYTIKISILKFRVYIFLLKSLILIRKMIKNEDKYFFLFKLIFLLVKMDY